MSAFASEIDRDAPFTLGELICTAILFVAGIALLATCCGGCKTYYENAGMRVRAGSVTAPIEVSEPTSSTNIRLLFFLDGVDLYATKGSEVRMTYNTANGGTWLTAASTQAVEVVVRPVAATNTVNQLSGTARH